MGKKRPLTTVLNRESTEKQRGPGNVPRETLDRVTLLAKRLKACIDALHGRSLADEEFGSLVERSRTTINNWLNGKAPPDPEALLRMFELLPEKEREKLVNDHCRTSPSLNHPRLSHDPVSVSRLRTLLNYPNSLTVIRGPAEHIVTFVVTAVGHSLLRCTLKGQFVTGLDAHNPDWFVPVPGVYYLGNLFSLGGIRTKALELWPSVLEARAEAVLLNSICRSVPEIYEGAFVLAKTSHVIIGEPIPPGEAAAMKRVPQTGYIVTVHEDTRDRIHLAIRAA